MSEAKPTIPRPFWIRIGDVAAMMSVSERTVKRYVASGTFPAPIKLTQRTSVWFEHEVIAWMHGQADQIRAAA